MARALRVLTDSKCGERGLLYLLDDGTWPSETQLRAVTPAKSWMRWRTSQGALETSGWKKSEVRQ